MKILALELSSAQGSIAWREDEAEPFVRSFSNDRKHSGLFFQNLRLYSKRFGAADSIVVGLGPGSYAGVRISIAAALGLSAAHGAKLIGLPSICAIDTTARDYSVIGDARRRSFFFARVTDGRLAEGPSLHSAAELEAKIVESRAPVYSSEPLPQFPQATLTFPSALRLAEIARDQSEEIAETGTLEPIYLRQPHITSPRASTLPAIKK